jgi:O-antigen ligase
MFSSAKLTTVGQRPLAGSQENAALDLSWLPILFLLAHIPLAMILQRSSLLAAAHALIVFALGVSWALRGRVDRVAWAAAYIVGAEVFWRMLRAPIPWEFGKYAVSALFLLALLRDRQALYGRLPLLYFLLLVPAAALIFEPNRLEWSRETISYNLSGPFSLAVSVCFFSWFRLSREDLYRLWWGLVAPMLSVLTIIVLTINAADSIYFGSSSNALLSGGFGPNQVSNVLGLGALLAFLLLSHQRTAPWLRFLLGLLLLAFAASSALTFSRGGFYTALGSILLFSFISLHDRQSRLRLLAFFAVIFLAAFYVVLPRLDAFTGGALVERFQDPSTTGRIELMQAEMVAFRENWLTGTGLGGSRAYHALTFRASAAHTEFTRLLAEHGIWGLAAQFLLLIMAWRHFWRARTARDRALVLSLTGWAFLFMMQAGMRLAAPGFIFGLAALIYLEDDPGEPTHTKSAQLRTVRSGTVLRV